MHCACKMTILLKKMPTLQIRELPKKLYDALKDAAARERRSISQQAIIELEKALKVTEDYREKRQRLLSQIESASHEFPKVDAETWLRWIREDRDR